MEKGKHVDFNLLVVNCHQHNTRFLIQIQRQLIHQTQVQLLIPNIKRRHNMLLHDLLNLLQRPELQIHTRRVLHLDHRLQRLEVLEHCPDPFLWCARVEIPDENVVVLRDVDISSRLPL